MFQPTASAIDEFAAHVACSGDGLEADLWCLLVAVAERYMEVGGRAAAGGASALVEIDSTVLGLRENLEGELLGLGG